LQLYILLIKVFSKQKPPVIYFHPYELLKSTPRIRWGPWLKRKVKYIGINDSLDKFKKLLNRFEFISIEDFLRSEKLRNRLK